MTNPHSADASFLGYYYQGMYALVKLLDAEDNDKISIETEDDVYLEGKTKKLHQLKHSLNKTGNLTVKNDGLWKTIRIWSKKIKDPDFDDTTYFVFASPLGIDKENSLYSLSIEGSDRQGALDSLISEAKRVKEARTKAEQKKEKDIPYSTRWPGCKSFLDLSILLQKELLKKITILPNNFNIRDVNFEVEKRVKNFVPPKIRSKLVERLIEWWDRRVVLGIINEAEREIKKIELTQHLFLLVTELSEEGLPDDFSERDEEVDIEKELGGTMEAQIDLVKGGNSRKRRAAIARWQARNQRAKWINDDLIHSMDLHKLDNRLIKSWRDFFEPLQEDNIGEEEGVLCKEGCSLLDWSHHKAHTEIAPIKSGWQHPFLVQGSFQQLADEMIVGWHPEYKSRLLKKEGGNNE
ncbi:hypothetical protein KJK41_04545 [Bacillus haikouensis]|nr:hypothetical protein KJK41_04545 [Bacillus haikouensis]